MAAACFEVEMALKEKLDAALKDAMRARDQLRMDTIRAVKSAATYKEVETGAPLDDDALLKVVAQLVKQRRDSAQAFRDGNRPELAEKEEREIGILQDFLPQQMSAAEVEAAVTQAIAETGARSMKDMGPVMKAALARVAGRAESRVVGDLVKKKLSGG